MNRQDLGVLAEVQLLELPLETDGLRRIACE